MLVLELKLGLSKKLVFIVNIYNLSLGVKHTGKFADILINVLEIQQRQLLIIGDINLHYTNWDNYTIYFPLPTQRFVE